MKKLPLFFSSPDANISGVNTFIVNLVRSLQERGRDARVVVTRHIIRNSCHCNAFRDVPTVSVAKGAWGGYAHTWRTLVRFLTDRMPCVFVPGYDWAYAWRVATLPPPVGTIYTLHSDEEVYYQAGQALTPHVDRIVAVSRAIAHELAARTSAAAEKTRIIPYGVPITDARLRREPRATDSRGRLKLLYVGRVIQYQKRIADLMEIVASLNAQGIPIELTVVGGGTPREEDRFRTAAGPWIAEGLLHWNGAVPLYEVTTEYPRHDVFVLTSEFEGLPLSLLEAMQAGCVPVVTAVRSGIPELIEHGRNGYAVPVGDVRAFSRSLEELYRDPGKRDRMAECARQTVRQRYTVAAMTDAWTAVIEKIESDLAHHQYSSRTRRVSGIPPEYQFAWSDYVPEGCRPAAIRAVGIGSGVMRRLSRVLRRVYRA